MPLANQPVSQIAADEPCPARNQCIQRSFPPYLIITTVYCVLLAKSGYISNQDQASSADLARCLCQTGNLEPVLRKAVQTKLGCGLEEMSGLPMRWLSLRET